MEWLGSPRTSRAASACKVMDHDFGILTQNQNKYDGQRSTSQEKIEHIEQYETDEEKLSQQTKSKMYCNKDEKNKSRKANSSPESYPRENDKTRKARKVKVIKPSPITACNVGKYDRLYSKLFSSKVTSQMTE